MQTEVKSDEDKLVELTQKEGILKTGEGEDTIVLQRLAGLNKALLEAENDRKNAEADYTTVSNSPDKVKALAEEKVGRFTTEQENNIRSLQSEVLKKVAELRQMRSMKLEEYQEGAPEIREIDAQIKSLEEFDRQSRGPVPYPG